jgi:hypothetical protein
LRARCARSAPVSRLFLLAGDPGPAGDAVPGLLQRLGLQHAAPLELAPQALLLPATMLPSSSLSPLPLLLLPLLLLPLLLWLLWLPPPSPLLLLLLHWAKAHRPPSRSAR